MPKRSTAAKKPVALKAAKKPVPLKAALRKPKPRYSTDDVFQLLRDVNRVTLKRIEDKIDYKFQYVFQRCTDIELPVLAIKSKVGA